MFKCPSDGHFPGIQIHIAAFICPLTIEILSFFINGQLAANADNGFFKDICFSLILLGKPQKKFCGPTTKRGGGKKPDP